MLPKYNPPQPNLDKNQDLHQDGLNFQEAQKVIENMLATRYEASLEGATIIAKEKGVTSGSIAEHPDGSKYYLKDFRKPESNELEGQAVRDFLFGNLSYMISQKKLPLNKLTTSPNKEHVASTEIPNFVPLGSSGLDFKTIERASDTFALNYLLCNGDIFNKGNIGVVKGYNDMGEEVPVMASLDYGLAGKQLIPLEAYIKDMHKFCSEDGIDALNMQSPDGASFITSLSKFIENPFFHKTNTTRNIYDMLDNQHSILKQKVTDKQELRQISNMVTEIKDNIEEAVKEGREFTQKLHEQQIPLKDVSSTALSPLLDMFNHDHSKGVDIHKLHPGALLPYEKQVATISLELGELMSKVNPQNFFNVMKTSKKHGIDLSKIDPNDSGEHQYLAQVQINSLICDKKIFSVDSIDRLFKDMKDSKNPIGLLKQWKTTLTVNEKDNIPSSIIPPAAVQAGHKLLDNMNPKSTLVPIHYDNTDKKPDKSHVRT